MIDASSLLEPTDLCVIDSTGDRLEVRTRVASWWLGGAGVIAMAGWAAAGLAGAGRMLLEGEVWDVISSLLMTVFGCAFLALFAFAATTERLIVTREAVEFQYRLFTGIVLRRWRLPHGDFLSAPKGIYVEGTESGSHQLELRTARGVKRFGSESKEENISALVEEIRRLRKG